MENEINGNEAIFRVSVVNPGSDLEEDENGYAVLEFYQSDPGFRKIRRRVSLPADAAKVLISTCWNAKNELEKKDDFDPGKAFWETDFDTNNVERLCFALQVRVRREKENTEFPNYLVRFGVFSTRKQIEVLVDEKNVWPLFALGLANIFNNKNEAVFVAGVENTSELAEDENGNAILPLYQQGPDKTRVRKGVSFPIDQAKEVLSKCFKAKKQIESKENYDSSQVFWEMNPATNKVASFDRLQFRLRLSDLANTSCPIHVKINVFAKNDIETWVDQENKSILLDLALSQFFITR